MGIKFNPFTGQFDIAGGSGGGTTPANRYELIFNDTTSWGAPAGGYYSITVLGTDHLKDIDAVTHVYEQDGSTYFDVDVDLISIDDNTADITIRVPETPDLRFSGKIVII